MDQIIAAIIGALIGGFLAAGTGILLDTHREKTKMERARKLLTTGICDDLQHSIPLYEKIYEEWDKTKIVWFSTINELRESRQTYQNNKDWILIFEDAELRKKIFRYYLQSADKFNMLENQQKRKYEIQGRYNDLVRNIKFQEPNITQEQASLKAISYMEAENKEFLHLQDSIPESVSKVSQFKIVAENLLNELRKIS